MRMPGSDQTRNRSHGDAHSPDAGLSTHHVWIQSDSVQRFHGISFTLVAAGFHIFFLASPSLECRARECKKWETAISALSPVLVTIGSPAMGYAYNVDGVKMQGSVCVK